MRKKKLKKELKKCKRSLSRVVNENISLKGDIRSLVYDPDSYSSANIKAVVRLEDDMEEMIFLGSGDKTRTQGIWRHLDEEK